MRESDQSSAERLSFFAELKRRKVFRVAFTYAIVGWLVIQIVVTTFPSLVIPDWAMRLVIMCVLLGFPIALVITWAFEITPEGIKRTSTARREGHWKSFTDAHNRKRNLIAFGFGATVPTVIFGALSLYIFLGSPRQETGRTIEKSIAVLPFENRSKLEEDLYFADGVHDDLLTQISRIGDIKTISRTSVMVYRDAPKNVREIAKELGVATVLEGGIQRWGDEVRINVQLIDAATDTHLWAETYTRKLTAGNLFAIQGEIAASIARTLRAVLSPEEQKRLQKLPTENFAALEQLFMAKLKTSEVSSGNLRDAIEYLRRAIELDPKFAEAHARLAEAYLSQIFYGGLPVEEQVAKAGPHISRALELDGNLSEAYLALGVLKRQVRDWPAAQAAYERAIELNPNDAQAYYDYGVFQFWDPRNSKLAAELFAKAVELNPQDVQAKRDLALALSGVGRFEEAKALLERLIAQDPDDPGLYRALGQLFRTALGRNDLSVKAFRQAYALDPDGPIALDGLVYAYRGLGDDDAAIFWCKRYLAVASGSDIAPVYRAWIHEIRGERELALADYREVPETSYFHDWAVSSLAANELRTGHSDDAVARFAACYQDLVDPEAVEPVRNFTVASEFIGLLFANGDTAQAESLTKRFLAAIDGAPRMGIRGYGANDAAVYVAQGDLGRALSAFREFVDAGAVSFWTSDDIYFEPLYDDPGFQKMEAVMKARRAEQRANLARMEANGELAPIPPLPGEAL